MRKMTMIVAGILLSNLAPAQLTENQRIGAFSFGAGVTLRENGIQPLRTDAPNGAVTINGTALRSDLGLVFISVDTYSGGNWIKMTVVITNLPGADKIITGRSITANALRSDTPFKDGSRTLELYEHLDLRAYRQKLNQLQVEQAAVQQEQARKHRDQANVRARTVALKSNQDAAAKGDAYGLLRMGERYRDGDGVDKDLAKAKDYLQRAADAGSDTAKSALEKLSAP